MAISDGFITLHDSEPSTFADGEFGGEDRYAVIGSEAAAKLVEAGPEPRLGTIAVVFSGGVFGPHELGCRVAGHGYGDCQYANEYTQPFGECHPRILKVQALRLGVGEHAFDEPAPPIVSQDARSTERLGTGHPPCQ